MTRVPSPADLAATARHEAGHAVASLVLCPKRTFVAEIYPNAEGRFGGQVRHPDSPPGDDGEPESTSDPFVPDFVADPDKAEEIDAHMIREGVILYAGCVAQIFNARGWTQEHAHCSSYDLRILSKMALAFGRDLQPHHVWWRAYDRACDLIDAEWGSVVAIATALEQRLSLTSAECAALRAGATPLENWMRGPEWSPAPNDPLPLLPDIFERIRRAARPRAEANE